MKHKKVKLQILGITFSQVQAGAYALILKEEDGQRRLPIIIGTPEAQSIAIFLEDLRPPRPLTHDLFITFIQAANIKLTAVNIYKYEEGVFFSEILFDNKGSELRIDSRTSDAIALALRTDSPVYTTGAIIDEVGIIVEEDDLPDEPDTLDLKKNKTPHEETDTENLQKKLNEAIIAEEYEKASRLRDLINQKKKRK
ncbi:MAG: bifunctional nuclease family protein [Candidatus Symbiothrix sp.]|nr:bifunctional nuclease family protein [Candidatus Symbiothrix sp.]